MNPNALFQRLLQLAQSGDPDALLELLRESHRRGDEEARNLVATQLLRWSTSRLPVPSGWRVHALEHHPTIGTLVGGGPSSFGHIADTTVPLLRRAPGEDDFIPAPLRAKRAIVAMATTTDDVTLLNAHGTLYTSSDGERWSTLTTPVVARTHWHLGYQPTALARSGPHIAIGCEGHRVVVSHDAGRTFHHSSDDVRATSFAYITDSLFSGGPSGIFASNTFGRTWSNVLAPDPQHRTWRVFSVRDTLYAAQQHAPGALYRSNDLQSWTRIFSDPRTVFALCTTRHNLLILSGDAGLLAISHDNGHSWLTLTPPPRPLHALLHTPQVTCIAGTSDGLLLGHMGAPPESRAFPGTLQRTPLDTTWPTVAQHTTPPLHSPTCALTFSPDDTLLHTFDLAGRLHTFDTTSGELLSGCDLPLGRDAPIIAADTAPSGDVFVASPNALLRVDTTSGTVERIASHADLRDVWSVDDDTLLVEARPEPLALYQRDPATDTWRATASWDTRIRAEQTLHIQVSLDRSVAAIATRADVTWIRLPELTRVTQTQRKDVLVLPDDTKHGWLLDLRRQRLRYTRMPGLRSRNAEATCASLSKHTFCARSPSALYITSSDPSAPVLRADLTTEPADIERVDTSAARTRPTPALRPIAAARSRDLFAWGSPDGALSLMLQGEAVVRLRGPITPPLSHDAHTLVPGPVRAWCTRDSGRELLVLGSRTLTAIDLSTGHITQLAHNITSSTNASLAATPDMLFLSDNGGTSAARTSHGLWSAYHAASGTLRWRATLPFSHLLAVSPERLLGLDPAQLFEVDAGTGELLSEHAPPRGETWYAIGAFEGHAMALSGTWRGMRGLIRVEEGETSALQTFDDATDQPRFSPDGLLVTRSACGIAVHDLSNGTLTTQGGVWASPYGHDAVFCEAETTHAVSRVSRRLVTSSRSSGALSVWGWDGLLQRRVVLPRGMTKPGGMLFSVSGEVLVTIHATRGVMAFSVV